MTWHYFLVFAILSALLWAGGAWGIMEEQIPQGIHPDGSWPSRFLHVHPLDVDNP